MTPSEAAPPQFRYRCLACRDSGVERCAPPPEAPKGTRYARPCVHCASGDAILAKWRKSIYADLTDEDVNRILGRACDHDPLPSSVPATADRVAIATYWLAVIREILSMPTRMFGDLPPEKAGELKEALAIDRLNERGIQYPQGAKEVVPGDQRGEPQEGGR